MNRMFWLLFAAYCIGVYVQYYNAPGWVGLVVGSGFALVSPLLESWLTQRRTGKTE